MTTAWDIETSLAVDVARLLVAAGMSVDLSDGEPTRGPDGTFAVVHTGTDGRVRATVIVTVTTGTATNRRASGESTIRARTVNVLVVAASRRACRGIAESVREVLDGHRLGKPHGLLEDASYDGEPLQEPDITPTRWSYPLAFNARTTRGT